MPDILRYIAFGVGLVIVFTGVILVILAESAPERMIDFLENLALGRGPRRRRRTQTARPRTEESAENPTHEHHELQETRRKRRVPWRLVSGIVVPLLTVLMGYPLMHQGSRATKTNCAPTANSEVLLHARHVDDSPPKQKEDQPCPVVAGEGFCGLVQRNAPFLEPILVALHMCPEQKPSVLTTVYVRPVRHNPLGGHGSAAHAGSARVMMVSRAATGGPVGNDWAVNWPGPN